MAQRSCTRNLARKAAIALGVLFAVPLLPTRAEAQTCTDEGGYQGGSITPLVRVKRDTEAYELLPRNPVPTGHGYNLYVDAQPAQVEGSCDDYDWNGSACVYDQTYLNTFSRIDGHYKRPWDVWRVIYEYAINPNGTTANVQSLDTTDDTKSSGGPVVVLPSGGSPSSQGFTTAGTYQVQMKSNVSETFCDPAELPWLDSGLLTFEVTHTDDAKDLCPGDDTAGPERENEPEFELTYSWEPPTGAGGADHVGNPCSARSRSKWEREVDFASPTLSFVRHYSSLALIDTGLGFGWSSNWHGKMLTPLATRLNVVRPTGHAQVFVKQTDGSWLGDADTRYAITQDTSGFVLTHRDGTQETYGPDGRLLSESDASGNTITLAYDASGRLITATGPFGHALSFAYDATGHLQTVTLPGGGTLTYGYGNDDLVSVTYPDTRIRSYHYELAAQPHKLTGTTDEKGVRYATFGYDSQGRAASTEHATTSNGAPQERFALAYPNSTQTTVTDPRGYQNRYTFAENLKYRNLTFKNHLPDGILVTQTFDARNNLLARQDELGRTTAFAWNATNQMTSRTEASGTGSARTTTYSYLSPTLDLPTAITRPSVYAGQSATTQISYHALHRRPTQITESGYRPDGAAVSRTLTFQYNAESQLTQVDGPRTDVSDLTTFAYHACTTGSECGQLASVTNALGHVTSFDAYDGAGRLLESTDPLGTVTTTTYDPRGRVLTTTRTPVSGAPRTWSFTYDANGQLETSTSPAGVVLTYEVDDAHDLRAIEDAAGNRIEYLYDLAGNRTSEKLKDPSGTLQHEIQAAYDTRNRVSELNDGGSITDIVFDATGQLSSQTDPNTHSTSFTYDLLGRLATQLDALSGVTDFDYQANDAVSQLTAPNGVATGYETDDLGNPVRETSPDRGTITTTADSAGNIVTVTGFGAGTFTYDALNRPLTRNYTGVVQDVTFGYDSCTNGTGRVCSINDEFSITSFEYDAFGNVVHKTETGGGNTYHTYYAWDGDDRLTQITYPTGQVVAYSHDAQGRIQGVTLDGANVVTARSYRGDGRLLSQTWGNGLAETRTYNGLGLLATYSLGSVESESFTYDAAGNLTSRSRSSWTLGYGYDALDRLTSDTGGSGSRGYAYDANGNRLTKTVDGSPTSYTYTTGTNRLATVGGSSIGSDGLGRITSVPGYTYLYSAANRLQSVQQSGATVASYAYDHRGLRRRKSTGYMGFNTTVYHYDEAGHLLAETNQSAGTVLLYVWSEDSPVAQKAGSVLT